VTSHEMRPGTTITLDVERPAVGGRMIARHDGRVVFLAGAIPGERVEARIERVQKQLVWAETTRVIAASPDRVPVPPGLACGGQVLAHVRDERQRILKAEMLADVFRRVGKIAEVEPPAVHGGAADGYRIRARLHLRRGQVGFFEEGTHRLCDVAASRQLATASAAAVARLAEAVAAAMPDGDAEIEWAEDVAGTTRVAHLTLGDGDPTRLTTLGPVAGIAGLSCSVAGDERTAGQQLWGVARVVDMLRGRHGNAIAIAHGPRAFFQSNRYLLQDLVDDVVGRLEGPVLDLYSGVGLFALAAAGAGHAVTAVEGDVASAADLVHNTAAHPGVIVHHQPVERHLTGTRPALGTVVVDPPRTGLSEAATRGLVAWTPARVVYVSCDPATLARDVRRFLDAGYRLGHVRGFDLFPRTGHVEAVVTLER
jgi:tRNA/tmRNA/rRNA uracil-C5-methylase (TrmA/RlmC/RlmD family)